jgi:hypothetical protein
MVWLLTSGFDKKPIVKIKTIGISKNNMPTLRLVISPIPPTMKGKTAPPAIPEHKIPDKDPWCSLTELSAKEKIIEYRKDNKKKIAENAKIYREENKEKSKKYREQNKEKLSENRKIKYEKNKKDQPKKVIRQRGIEGL